MSEEDVTIIGSSDGPTSVFIAGESHKSNLKQQLQKKCFELSKKWHTLWIKPNPHTIEEVVEYIRKKYDFIEVSRNSKKYQRLYKELRSSFIMQYEPQLLGEYAALPELKSQKDIHMEIQLESRFEYIGGGTSGRKVSKFHKIYKDVYKYYGVSEDDINNHTKRYENLLRQLAMRH